MPAAHTPSKIEQKMMMMVIPGNGDAAPVTPGNGGVAPAMPVKNPPCSGVSSTLEFEAAVEEIVELGSELFAINCTASCSWKAQRSRYSSTSSSHISVFSDELGCPSLTTIPSYGIDSVADGVGVSRLRSPRSRNSIGMSCAAVQTVDVVEVVVVLVVW